VSSLGERLIVDILNENSIAYTRQYRVQFNGHTHIFDFHLTVQVGNEPLELFIEFDGGQHFSEITFYHRIQGAFEKRRKRDLEKQVYCWVHHKPLLRIPYWKVKHLREIILSTVRNLSYHTFDTLLTPPDDYFKDGPRE
jgi:hypothetical protein